MWAILPAIDAANFLADIGAASSPVFTDLWPFTGWIIAVLLGLTVIGILLDMFRHNR